MAKKSVSIGNYTIEQLDSGTTEVRRMSDNSLCDNTKEALRQIAQSIGFRYDEGWNTRTFGSKLIDVISLAKRSAVSGEYLITRHESGSIEVYRVYDNTKAALREVAQSIGFAYDDSWTTRQFGSKLIDALNGK